MVVTKDRIGMAHPLFLTSPRACGKTTPPKRSAIATIALIVSGLTLMEQVARAGLYHFRSAHVLLEEAQHRNVIARCVFVDAISCAICAYLGLTHMHLLKGIYKSLFHRDTKAMSASTAHSRGITYHPGAYFLCLYFLSYQLKDMYDLYLWGDQWIYILHHVVTIEASWGAMYPGYAQLYAIFFCGLGEISTLPLSLLPIFDAEKGIVGLEEMYPTTKLVIGLVFVTLFLLCRCIVWPICSYYFVKDAIQHLKDDSGVAKSMRPWICEKIVVNCILSALQLSFVLVIISTLAEEFN